MKIVADKNIPYLKGIAEYFGEVVYLPGNEFTQESLKDADSLIVRTVTHFDRHILEGTNVKLICSATIGYDHIDTQYCDEAGIVWKNAPGCNSGSVMQYIVSALLTISRKKGFSLHGKTIGIIGVGNVGSKVAKACQILGMKVLLNDPPRQKNESSELFVDLDTIKREADIITFHTPLTKEGEYKTYHLGDEEFFDSLAKQPVIINSARGGIVDTEAIKMAIKTGLVSGAIIDCWESEPNIDREYMEIVDIATPHIAGYSADGKANASRMSLESIADFWSLPKDHIKEVVAPLIENSVIDFSNLKAGDVVADSVLAAYNILDDHNAFIADPDKFSYLRSHYPIRREYGAYTVYNSSKKSGELLRSLGFNIE